MRQIVVGLLGLLACSKTESHSRTEIHVTAGSGSAAGSGGAPAADEAALSAVAEPIEVGDSWKAAVLSVVAVAGPPNIVNDQGGPELDWFAAGKDTCTVLELRADGSFVKSVDTSQFGEASDDYKPCTLALKKHAAVPALTDPPKVEVEAPARAVLAAWHDGQFQKIFDEAHPELRGSVGSPDTFARLARLFEPLAGKFVKPGEPFKYSIKDFGYVVSGPAIYDKGTLDFALSFRVVDGAPKLTNFNLKLPEELRAKPDNADAEKLSRRALDATLTGKFDAVVAMGADDLLKAVKANPGAVKDLSKLGTSFGKVKSIKLTEEKDCDGKRCVTYQVVGAKKHGTAEVVTVFAVSEWEVAGVTLTPE